MAHEFPASIEVGCIRDVIAIARKGSERTRDDMFDVRNHSCYFFGSLNEWVRKNGGDDVSWRELASLLTKQILGVQVFGELPGDYDSMSLDELCQEVESNCDACDVTEGEYAAIPVIAIISLVVSVIKLLRDLDIIEPTPEGN